MCYTFLAPHLHAAVRGAIPRETLRRVIKATYVQVWWPEFDVPVYVDRIPVWTGAGQLAAVAADLTAWLRLLDLAVAEPKLLRFKMLHVPARLSRSSRWWRRLGNASRQPAPAPTSANYATTPAPGATPLALGGQILEAFHRIMLIPAPT